MSQDVPIVVTLGRYGDIINALPIAWDLAQHGTTPKFVVSSEFWRILEGVSYVNPVVWDMDYKNIPFAIQRTKGLKAHIAQVYTHPDQTRKTSSYQMESWERAGYLDKFGKLPLVFDRRDKKRENEVELKAALLTDPFTVNKSTILVSGKGVSSPFKGDLVGEIRKAFPGYNVVDLSSIRVERVYDLLGLMDNSALLVTIDTMHLHLAAASKIPVVAILNDGWYGSIPPPNTIASFCYSELANSLEPVLKAIKVKCP